MNRRHFFGMTAGALALAGLPAFLLPERTIFLPPSGGWVPGIRMRWVEQYVITDDSIPIRFDALGMDASGVLYQFHVDQSQILASEREVIMGGYRVMNHPPQMRIDSARSIMADMFHRWGLTPIEPNTPGLSMQLRLPKYDIAKGYV